MVETVRTNFKESYNPDLICKSCHMSECNQAHLIYSAKLIGSNELASYILDKDILNNDDLKE